MYLDLNKEPAVKSHSQLIINFSFEFLFLEILLICHPLLQPYSLTFKTVRYFLVHDFKEAFSIYDLNFGILAFFF